MKIEGFSRALGRFFYISLAFLFVLCFCLFTTRPHILESIVGAIIIFFLLDYYMIREEDFKWIDKLSGYKIWLLGFGTRLVFILFVQDKVEQTSDFAITLSEASSGVFTDNLEYYRNWVHKLIYPLLLHEFGFTSSQRIYILQCFLVGFICLLVYELAKKISGQRGGAIAALIYILWPGQIIYTSMISEEHVAALLTLLLAYMILELYDDLKHGYNTKGDYIRYVIKVLVAGMLFGASVVFKDWGAVILVATIISSIWVITELKSWKATGFIIATLVMLIGVRLGVSSMILGYASDRLGADLSNNVVISSMYGTLDPDSTGEFSQKGDDEYFEIVRKNNYDYDAANKEALSILWSKIKEKPEKMPALLLRKGRTSYSDDGSMLFWAFVMNAKDEETFTIYRSWIQIIWYIATIYYCMVVLCIIGAMLYKANRYKFFLGLVIFGGIMVNLIIESHGRYKYSIEPVWCVMAAMFLDSLFSKRVVKSL